MNIKHKVLIKWGNYSNKRFNASKCRVIFQHYDPSTNEKYFTLLEKENFIELDKIINLEEEERIAVDKDNARKIWDKLISNDFLVVNLDHKISNDYHYPRRKNYLKWFSQKEKWYH